MIVSAARQVILLQVGKSRRELDIGRAMSLVALNERTDLQRQVIRGLPQHGKVPSLRVGQVDAALPGDDILDVTGLGPGKAAGTDRKRVAQRHVDRRALTVAGTRAVMNVLEACFQSTGQL